jgi:hypothetical protein
MRNLFVVLTVAAFGLAALPADALTVKKGAEKVAAKGKAKKAGKVAPAEKGKKGEAPKKDQK